MKQLRIIIICFIGLAVGAFLWFGLGQDPESLLIERLELEQGQLIPAILILAALILLSALSGLPVLYLTMALGFMLPFFPAMLLAMLINTVAVMATFYVVRYAFSSYFQEKFGSKKLIRRINIRIHRYGMWTVVFSRAIYILPTNVINFSFPLSRIHPRAYLLGTILGLVPECLINVGSGYLLRHELMLLSSPESRGWQALAIGAFILLFALVFVFLTLRQKRRKKFKRLKAVPYRG